MIQELEEGGRPANTTARGGVGVHLVWRYPHPEEEGLDTYHFINSDSLEFICIKTGHLRHFTTRKGSVGTGAFL